MTNSERRVQRVRKALAPPGQARDDIAILADLARRMGRDLGDPTAGGSSGTSCALVSPMHAGMSYARLEALGGIQWPCPDEAHPGEPFLHGRLWEEPTSRGRRAPFAAVENARPVEALDARVPAPADDRAAARLVQHRRADRRVRLAAPARRGARAVAPTTRRASGVRRASACASRSRRGSVVAPVRFDPGLMPGLVVHDAPLPGRGGHQPADHRRRPIPRAGRRSSRRPRSASTSSTRRAPPSQDDRGPHPIPAPRRDAEREPPSTPCSAPRRTASTVGAARRPRRGGTCSCRRSTRPGARGVGEPGRARLRLRAAARPAGRGVRRRELLRALLLEGAARRDGRPRLRRHRLQGRAAPTRSCAELTASLGHPGDAGPASSTWLRSPCLGLCEQAPAAMLVAAGEAPFERGFGHATPPSVVRRCRRTDRPTPRSAAHRPPAGAASPGLRLLRRVGVVDPASLDAYRAHGGYRALRRALEIGPARRDPRGHRVEARRPRRRGVPHGAQVGGRRARRRARRTTSCATPTSPSRAPSRTAC